MKAPLIVAVVLMSFGCGGDTGTGPSGRRIMLTGRVLDFRSQAGLSGVSVHFAGDSQAADVRATSDPSGRYEVPLPPGQSFTVSVDDDYAGTVIAASATHRGDLLVRGGACVSRYGVLLDLGTRRPIAGATVTLPGASTTSGIEGWYRLDLGCPDVALPGNTTFMTVTHPNFATKQQVVGRGVTGVSRIDLELERK